MTNVLADLHRLRGEADEAIEAYENGGEGLGQELADVAIYTPGIAKMAGLDIDTEVQMKLAVVKARRYERQPDGRLVKIGPDLVPRPPEPGQSIDLREVQEQVWAHMVAHGCNTTDVHADLHGLRGEVDEATEAFENGGAGLGAELADVIMHCAGTAQMAGLSLDTEVQGKLAIIKQRHYEHGADGKLVKVGPDRRPGTELEAG
jgi:NTP pyrophosphatase (non-canonical NTP hydrolase)